MRQICTHIVRLVSALIGILMLSSCMDDLKLVVTPKPQENVEVGIYAGGAQTRTTMLDNGLSAAWTAGDELAVWAKNSSGSFILSKQIFKTYGIDGKQGYFTTTLSEPMPEGQYTYYCSYPAPLSVNGTMATFNLPAIQDGKVTGGADIMIATPADFGPLIPMSLTDNYDGMSLKMNRMMHQFRFYVPQTDTKLGDELIESIFLDFPKPVAGDVTLDLSNSSAPATLSNSSGQVTLNLADPISKSNETNEEYDYACVAIAPASFEAGQIMNLKAYTDDKVVYFDPIDLRAREFKAGHSTPVKLNIKDIADFAGLITFTVVANNLGEDPNFIKLEAPSGCKFGEDGSNIFTYNPGRKIEVGEKIVFKYETEAAYTAFNGKTIKVTYDSDNAIMTQDVTVSTNSLRSDVSLTVPYLLFEDFSCISKEGESYGNNKYASDEKEQPGSSLDGFMGHKGWNAARFWVKGQSVRINTRYQEVSIKIPFTDIKLTFASTHHGRLDTPKLAGLKKGSSVTLNVSFDAGGYKHKSSSLDLVSQFISVATHTKEGKLDGIPTGATGISSSYDTTLDDFGTTYETISLSLGSGEDDFTGKYPNYSAEVHDVTSSTRICFYPTFTASSGVGNSELHVYIDNIKVKIVK